MKRMLNLLLVLSMVLSLFAGCGSAQAEKKTEESTVAVTTQPTETAEPTTEPTTEPTLSAEEMLIASLPEQMRQVYELGIADLDMLADLQRECTIAEAVQMLQNAYTLHHGTESRLLVDILMLDYISEPAYLGWIGRLPAGLLVEGVMPEKYENYQQWMKYMVACAGDYTIQKLTLGGSAHFYCDTYPSEERSIAAGSWFWFDEGWITGMRNRYYEDAEPGNAVLETCAGQGAVLAAAMELYDRTNGERVLPYDMEDHIPVEQVLTVEQMAGMALRTYHCLYVPEDPVPYEQCTVADDTILTPELLGKETSLPDASCSSLPAQWHGVIMDELYRIAMDITMQFDREIYEYEIQAVKDAGFNYIGLQLDFGWLQGADYYHRNSLDGCLDRNRLEKLDQILAWCIERDIHLDLRATGVGGYVAGSNSHWDRSPESAQKYAQIWGILARRYAQVPNVYLSFTVMDDKDGEQMDVHWFTQGGMVRFVEPSVNAIREASPDRCIIVDISGELAKGDEVLSLGVALSADLTAKNGFFNISSNNYLVSDYYLNMQWPYNGTCDAESLMNDTSWNLVSVLDLADKAQENGLGFMISSWGSIPRGMWAAQHSTVRYPDETYQAFITDVAQTLDSYGFGWCYEEWYGLRGITYAAPLTTNVIYAQIGEYPMYYDTAMWSWFLEINGVK